MRAIRLSAVLTLLLPVVAPEPLPAQPAPARSSGNAVGVIEGRVFNAATGSTLANARVTLDGLAREVFTDDAGEFRLIGVPAGAAGISVTYLGMVPQRAEVTVAADATARRDFELQLVRAGGAVAAGQTVKLDAFNVVEAREMSAQAISMNEQRNAPNIKNVVAIDEFGDRGAENIASSCSSSQASRSRPPAPSRRPSPCADFPATTRG